MSDSRSFVPELLALLEHRDARRVELLAPSPGLWRDAPAVGALIRPGDSIGSLEVLGTEHRLRAPDGAQGIVLADNHESELTRRPVDYGARLLSLDPDTLVRGATGPGAIASEQGAGSKAGHEGTLVFTSPSSGRFYQRPSPDRPAFVELGQILERGQTIGLLEVMKTFTRINYDDPKLPARAKVVAMLAIDQGDLGRGDPILQLEAVP
jgi:acetyl-CoA carboxylase biotin carboxyl carrier protein